MQRTSKRPVPSGRIYPSEALAIGISFCLVSIYIFLIYINPISTALTLLGIIYYVYFYSILLKKATVQNIVIGGGAGALPSVIGWTAVTGQISVQAFLLFLIVFLWTPPHFWALAIVRKNDYAKVKIPMLPVIMGEAFTRRSIFNYSIILVLSTLLLPLFQYTGSVFLLSSVLLGVGFIFLAWRVVKVEGNKVAWTLYKYSSYYLFFIFIALIVDSLIA
jgi:protoheme IX farnesyltransferase